MGTASTGRWAVGRIVAALLALAATVVSRAASPEIACGSPADLGGGHAWLIRAEDPGPVLIWHMPPRTSGSTPGRTRIAAETRAMPEGAAAVGARLYMIFEDKPPAPPAKPRQVLSLSAVPTSDPGRWMTLPAGRMESAPSFRADGKLLSTVGSAGAPWVLLHGLREDGANPTRLSLMRLKNEGWTEVDLPESVQTLAGQATRITGNQVAMTLSWRLVASPQGVGVLAFDPSGTPIQQPGSPAQPSPIAAWIGEFPPEQQPVWSPMALTAPSTGSLESLAVCTTGGRLVAALTGPSNSLMLFARGLRAPEPEFTPLATLNGVAAPYSLAPMDADGVAAVFFAEPPTAGSDPRERMSRMVGEVSARTGRIMYQGRLIGIAPVAPSDYRLMTLLMILVVGSVVLFIARPPGESPEVHLPKECSLAGAGRRSIAAGIDVLIGLFAAASVWRVPAGSLLDLEWWGAADSWSVGITALVLLVCGCTLCEAFMGKTVGKVLCGCEVVSIKKEKGDGDGVPPPFTAALLRNLLKWTVPVIGLVGVLDAARRHRADEWAGTAVIVRASPDEEE